MALQRTKLLDVTAVVGMSTVGIFTVGINTVRQGGGAVCIAYTSYLRTVIMHNTGLATARVVLYFNPNTPSVVGYGSTAQRILRAIKKPHPELDIRLVFYDCNKKVQGSNLTCKAWATKYNFKFADKAIPIEWIK